MRARIQSHLTYANVISTIALFAVLGGGAYATHKVTANEIARNAVRAKHVKGNQIRARHVKKNQVRTRHIRDGAVTRAKLAAGAGLFVISGAGRLESSGSAPYTRYFALNGDSPSPADIRRNLSPSIALRTIRIDAFVLTHPGGGNSLTFTLQRNGADTTPSVTCRIPTGSTTCTGRIAGTIPPLSQLSMKVVNTALAPDAEVGWSVQFE